MTAVLEARSLSKLYGAVVANNHINFAVEPGEVVALVGDNGAGKSTLVKLLSGADKPTSGEIRFRGEVVEFDTPQQARALGIETVYQDLSLVPNLDVASNLFLGRELTHKPGLLLRQRQMVEGALSHITELGARIPTVYGLPVSRLSGGQRQAIAIARAAFWASAVLFMDEPTAALGVRQSQVVLDLIRQVSDRGIAVILVTHILPHALAVSQRVVVLRHGRKVGDAPAEELGMERVVSMIVGAEG